MRIKTISPRIKDGALRVNIVYPLCQCEADPHAAPYAPQFVALLDKWGVIHTTGLDLEDQRAKAQARVDRAFVQMGRVAERVSMEALFLTDGDRTHGTYTHFFGDRSVSAFNKRRQIKRLSDMIGWVGSLKDSGKPTLMAIVPDLTATLGEAEEALKAREAAEVEKSKFRDIGERKLFIDEVNGVRKTVHGELGKLRHQIDGLPSDYADRFFRPESSDDDEEEEQEPTLDSVNEQIELRAKEISELEDLREEILAKKAEEEKAAAALEADKAALAQLEKTAAENEKLIAKLRAKIESV